MTAIHLEMCHALVSVLFPSTYFNPVYERNKRLYFSTLLGCEVWIKLNNNNFKTKKLKCAYIIKKGKTGSEDSNRTQNCTEILAHHFKSYGYRTYWKRYKVNFTIIGNTEEV
jgi:hypothetical protein